MYEYIDWYAYQDAIWHHGIIGQKWGIRRYQNPDGSLTEEGRKRYGTQRFRKSNGGTYSKSDIVFVSGKVKFDEPIPSQVEKELDSVINAGSKIIIGDAPGADTRCQEYLANSKYKNVVVYTTDENVRNNIGNWPVERIKSYGFETEREIRAQKDIAMSNIATKGIVISTKDDRLDSATSKNIYRLAEKKIPLQMYDFKEKSLNKLKHSDIKEPEYLISQYLFPNSSSKQEILFQALIEARHNK